MMPLGWTAILASVSGITLAIAYWLRPNRVQQ
jgi:hypothetical protein